MNGGVSILIARMETHPEEFFTGSRWIRLINDYETILDPDDNKALKEAYRKCRQQEFTQLVMTRLIGEEKEEKELSEKYSSARLRRRPNGLLVADDEDNDE